MKLKKLLKDIPVTLVKGSKEMEITGICPNSKLVAPGNLFIAKKGRAENGALFIPEALAAGAVAVLTDIYDPSLKNITQIIHPDVASIENLLAAQYYQFPSDELYMVGITGTNGKTTTSFLVKHLLDHLDRPGGLIGTIEYIIGKYRYQASRTTPDVCSNHKMLREMLLQKCPHAVMEVTSHALDQGRVQSIDFDVAVFTNLTLDHLDYHNTMENYFNAKNKLFSSLNPHKKKRSHHFPKTAVVNVDSPWHHRIVKECHAPIITYGIENRADLHAKNIVFSSTKTQMTLCYQKQCVSLQFPLIGRFNVYNCLATVAVGLARRVPLDIIAPILQSAPPVPGRLEPVPNPLGLKIYVDFAHSDDALANVFECLRELKTGRLITIFGCGGDRDATKRPKMAQVCEEFSDIIIVTSDNPRSEDPIAIAKQIAQGFTRKDCYVLELDRRKAIAHAISRASSDDIILIAGKGHETYQIFAHKTVEFDDRKVAFQICQQKAAQTVTNNT
jgi:UDP-N-acetylmuramoyl-L-alanyl-D-glutamate--2,6-diaminopimelate ligase